MDGIINLPRVPSKLIRLAIADVGRLDRDVYKPDAMTYHCVREDEGPKCCVCFAGAVIAGTLGMHRDDQVDLDDLQPDTRSALESLDSFRCGWILDGVRRLIGHEESLAYDEALQNIEKWYWNKTLRHGNFYSWPQFEEFVEEMEELARRLELIDL